MKFFKPISRGQLESQISHTALPDDRVDSLDICVDTVVHPTAKIFHLATNSGISLRPQRVSAVAEACGSEQQTLKLKPPKQREVRVPGVPGMVEITYRTGGGAWYYRYTDPVTGKRNSIRVGIVGQDSFMAAVARVKAHKDAIAQGRSPKAAQILCGDFVSNDYGEWAVKNKVSAADDQSRYILYLARFIGQMPIGDVNKHHLERALEFWRNGNRSIRRSQLSNATINRIAMLARSIFRLAVVLGYISENPAKGLRNLKETPPSPVALDTDGLKKLFRALQSADPKLALVVDTSFMGALRINETMELKYEDIDRKNGLVHLRKTKAGVAQTIPLSEALDAVFRRAEVFRRDGNDYIFPASRGDGPMTAPRKAWNKLLADAGLDHSGFHILRKTWASQAMSVPGMDILTVSRMLRHQSIRTTERHYIATPQQRLRQASHAVNALLLDQLPAPHPNRPMLAPSVISICITRQVCCVISRGVCMN